MAPSDTTVEHPGDVQRRPVRIRAVNHYNVPRIPAFWYTLNFPFNYLHEIHRFKQATDRCKDVFCFGKQIAKLDDATVGKMPFDEVFKDRQRWVLDNPDIVAQLHAVRVELLIRSVMSGIVPLRPGESFHYWARFEWGKNGNPHAHGLAFVPRNPYFDRVLKNEEHRQLLLQKGYKVALTETWAQAEVKIADFFDD